MSQSQDFANEEWKPVIGYESLYEISSLGRVRRVQSGYRKQAGTTLKTPNDGKYSRCGLWKDGKCRSILVHRMVARVFLGEPALDEQANHIDGVKTNNCVSNLEWTSPKGNIHHAFRMGLIESGESHVFAKLSEAEVRIIKSELATGATLNSLACRFNVTKENISSIKRGKTWRFTAA